MGTIEIEKGIGELEGKIGNSWLRKKKEER